MKFRSLLLIAVALSLLPLPLFSQAITAKVVGTVTDPSSAVVPNVKV